MPTLLDRQCSPRQGTLLQASPEISQAYPEMSRTYPETPWVYHGTLQADPETS